MSEWIDSPLGTLVSFKKGKKVNTSDLPIDGYLPYLGASSLTGGADGFASPVGGVQCLPDDALMLWDGERSGLVGPGKEGIISSTVMRLRPEGAMRGRYLCHALEGQFEWIQARRTGTGVPHVPKDLGRILRLKFPKLSDEQNVISDILDCIDSQIEAMEALIAKQERVRAGLLQDLFTRGVDEHGALRPPRDERPSLYHETELGWLPKGWEAPKLSCLLSANGTPMRSGPFGSALLKHELVDSGIPFLGIDNIHVERFNSAFQRFVSPSKFAELIRYRVLPEDVVITIMGTVGRCCVIPDGFGEMLSSKHLWTMTFDKEKILPTLVCWQLNCAPWVSSWFRCKSQGGIMDAIQSSTLKELRLPQPPRSEQGVIAKIGKEARETIDRIKIEASKLRLLKSGLMQDLLTGRVLVDALLESEPT